MKEKRPRSYEDRTFNFSPNVIDHIKASRKRHNLTNKEAVERAISLQRVVDEIQANGGVIWVSNPGEEDELLEDTIEFEHLIGKKSTKVILAPILVEIEEDVLPNQDSGNIIQFRNRS